jgi:hypothetical protein
MPDVQTAMGLCFQRGFCAGTLPEVGRQVRITRLESRALTFLHYVEHVADIPGKRVTRYRVPIMENGCRVRRAMEEFDTSGDGGLSGISLFPRACGQSLLVFAAYSRRPSAG